MCAISAEATQEAALEGMLRKVQEKWSGVELTVQQYKEAKDAYILGSVEDVQSVLEDSLAMMSTICSSRYVAGSLHYMANARRHAVAVMPLQSTCFSRQDLKQTLLVTAVTRPTSVVGGSSGCCVCFMHDKPDM